MERESMEFDVVVVGAGPSGLATAIGASPDPAAAITINRCHMVVAQAVRNAVSGGKMFAGPLINAAAIQAIRARANPDMPLCIPE